jgi:hypothetical protein
MAIIVPEAEWRPFTGKSTTPVRQDILCAHTIVGSNESAIAWGGQDGKPYAHCYTSCRGKTVQCKGLEYRAAANLEGNPYVLAWETEDSNSVCFDPWTKTCGNVPAWTDAQVARLIKDFAWACIRFDIPPVLIPDTKAGRRGLAYHRMGVPNSPEWVSGNLAWTSSSGKCCPDWRRIAQFKTKVVPGVAAIVNQEKDMPLNDDDKTIIRNILKQEIPALVQAAVDNRFSASGSDVRQQLAGSGDVNSSLIELALQKSNTFQKLVAKVDELGAT